MNACRSRQPALLAALPRSDVAGRRAQQRHRAARRRDTTPTCAKSASSCSPTAPGPRPTSSNSSVSRSVPPAALARRSTPTRRRRRSRVVRRRAADRAWLGGRRGQIAQGRGQAAAQPRAAGRATRWSAAAGSMSAPRRRDGEIELAIRAEGPRILLDPVLRETWRGREAAGRSSRALPAPGSRTASPPKPAARSSCPTRRRQC